MKLTNHQVADRTATVGPDTLRFPDPRPLRLHNLLGHRKKRRPMDGGWIDVTDLVADNDGSLYIPTDAVIRPRPSAGNDVHVTVRDDDTVNVASRVPLVAVSRVTDPTVAYAPVTDLLAPDRSLTPE